MPANVIPGGKYESKFHRLQRKLLENTTTAANSLADCKISTSLKNINSQLTSTGQLPFKTNNNNTKDSPDQNDVGAGVTTQAGAMQRIEEVTGRFLNQFLTRVRDPMQAHQQQTEPRQKPQPLKQQQQPQQIPTQKSVAGRKVAAGSNNATKSNNFGQERRHSMRNNNKSKSSALTSSGLDRSGSMRQACSFRTTKTNQFNKVKESGLIGPNHRQASTDELGVKWVNNMRASIKRSFNNLNNPSLATTSVQNQVVTGPGGPSRKATNLLAMHRSTAGDSMAKVRRRLSFVGSSSPCIRLVSRNSTNNGSQKSKWVNQSMTQGSMRSTRSQMNNWLSATSKRTSLSLIQLFIMLNILFIGIATSAPAMLISRANDDIENNDENYLVVNGDNSENNSFESAAPGILPETTMMSYDTDDDVVLPARSQEADDSDDNNDSNERDDGQEDNQDQELFMVDRRRLNRDRALEPAPWLREQPMRRASEPPIRLERAGQGDDNSNNVADDEPMDDNQEPSEKKPVDENDVESKVRSERDLRVDEMYLDLIRELVDSLLAIETPNQQQNNQQESSGQQKSLAGQQQREPEPEAMLLEHAQQSDEIAGVPDSTIEGRVLGEDGQVGMVIEGKTNIDNDGRESSGDENRSLPGLGAHSSIRLNSDVELILPYLAAKLQADKLDRRVAHLINEPSSGLPSGPAQLTSSADTSSSSFHTVEDIDRDSGSPSDLETKWAIMRSQQQQNSEPLPVQQLQLEVQKRTVMDLMKLDDQELRQLLLLSLLSKNRTNNNTVGQQQDQQRASAPAPGAQAIKPEKAKQVSQQQSSSIIGRFFKAASSWVPGVGGAKSTAQPPAKVVDGSPRGMDSSKLVGAKNNNNIGKSQVKLARTKPKVTSASAAQMVGRYPLEASLGKILLPTNSYLSNEQRQLDENSDEDENELRLGQISGRLANPTAYGLKIGSPISQALQVQQPPAWSPFDGLRRPPPKLVQLVRADSADDDDDGVAAANNFATLPLINVENVALDNDDDSEDDDVASNQRLISVGYADQLDLSANANQRSLLVEDPLSMLAILTQLQLQAQQARLLQQQSAPATRIQPALVIKTINGGEPADSGRFSLLTLAFFGLLILCSLYLLLKLVLYKSQSLRATSTKARNAFMGDNSSDAGDLVGGCDADSGLATECGEREETVARRLARTGSAKLAKLWPRTDGVGHYSAFFGQVGSSQKDLQSVACSMQSQETSADQFSVDGQSLADYSPNSDSKQQNQATARGLTGLANRLSSMLQNHVAWSSQSSKTFDATNQTPSPCKDEMLEVEDGLRQASATTTASGEQFVDNAKLIDVVAGSKTTQKTNSKDEGDDCDDDTSSQCRSSRSYIKSLVDVLSNARNQLPSHNRFIGKKQAPVAAIEDEDDFDDCTDETRLMMPSNCNNLQQQSYATIDSDNTQMLAQMDISAAHLILSYMEKHMDDKERLRREWDELCAASNKQQTNGNNNAKYNRLLIEKKAQVALARDNKQKNRSMKVVPFDRNRVKLGVASVANNSGKQTISDYINASFIHDDNPRRPTHIISQGPLDTTVAQFWQMVWEQGVSVIVMLTRLNENSVKMCHSYWPTDSPSSTSPKSLAGLTSPLASTSTAPGAGAAQPAAGPSSASQAAQNSSNTTGDCSPDNARNNPTTSSSFDARRGSVTSVFSGAASKNWQPIIANGSVSTNVIQFELPNGGGLTKFEVHLVSEHVSSPDYLVRNMYMINRKSGETRTITQFHYLAWPENGVPANVKSFLQFRRKVNKSYRDPKSPILVHCSDGAGRSGTYTLIDIILERIKNGTKEIDPRATLEHLRDQRVGLCATQKQFEFVMVALAEEIQLIIDSLPK